MPRILRPGPRWAPPLLGVGQWLDARFRVEGSPVDTWRDLSANGRNATQSGAARPAVNATGWSDGGPCLVFNRSTPNWLNNNAILPLLTLLPDVSVVSLLRPSAASVDANIAGAGWTGGSALLQWYVSSSNIQTMWNRSDAAALKAIYNSAYTVGTTRDLLLAWVYDGATSHLYCNGVKATGDAAPGATHLDAAAIGATLVGGATPANCLSANMRSFGVFSRAIEDSDYLALCAHQVGGAFASVVCDGNSLTAGQGATAGYDYPSQLASLLGQRYYLSNIGVGAQTTTQMAADFASEVVPLFVALRNSVYIPWEVTNDIYFGASAADAVAHYWSLCDTAKAAGFKVIAATIIPRDNFDEDQEIERLAANALILAQYSSHADAICDLASIPALQDCENETYFYTDHIHLNDTGYGVVAAAFATQVHKVAP